MERKIGIDTNVGVKFCDDSGNIIDEIYKSRLLSDIDSNEILIDGKCFESLNFKVDSIIYVIFYPENELYLSKGKIVGFQRIRDKITVKIKIDGLIRIQRRDYSRVKTAVPVIIDSREYTTFDISGGGLGFRLSVSESQSLNFKVGNIVKGILKLPTEDVEFSGKILRNFYDKESKQNNVGLQFCDLDDKIREKIIKFVFDVERKNKKS